MVGPDSDAMTFPRLLLKHAAERGNDPATREKDLGIWQTWTWAQVAAEVRVLACGLAAQGFKRGMHLAIIGDNRPRLYWSMTAAQALGGVPVPLYQDAPTPEFVYVLNNAEIAYAVVEDQEQVDKIVEATSQVPTLKHIYYDDPRGLRNYEGVTSFERLLEIGREFDRAHPDFYEGEVAKGRPDDVSIMLYTSGTTGKPKGVCQTHQSFIDAARSGVAFDHLTAEEDILSYLPMASTAGAAIGTDLFLFYRSIGVNLKQLYGSTETCAAVCLQPDGEIKFDSVGKPVPGIEVRIGDNGEVLVRGPILLKEYYKRPDATAESMDAQGYFHTGDAGFFDEDGHLKIIDRAKDVGKLATGAMFAPNYIENKLKFFPHIKEAVAFGNDRDKVCAFINIDIGSVGNWAERRGIPYSGYTDLAAKPEVYELVRECVEKVNAELANEGSLSDSQVRRFLILHKELDPDDDELTRTRKVRRGFVAEKYAVLIDALYSGKPSQYIETQVKFEDGRTGIVKADLRIIDVAPQPPLAKAA